ncbi:MAG: YfcC family protein [Gemmatimonadetes bacterium]|nr:YfcC family protein [Gemmatimonadota bacterium]
MQEEIIPLVPVLLILGRGLGIDAVAVVGMSAGAAMIGSAFGPTNPFQAGIAMKLAQLPPASAFGLRFAMLAAAFVLWVAWTMRYASKRRTEITLSDDTPAARVSAKDVLILLLVLSPMAAYVYGSIALGWGFNELSAGFLIGASIAGVLGGLGVAGTTAAYLEGMQGLLPAALLIGVARSISLVLSEGHVIDTMLQALAAPLGNAPPLVAALAMIPAQALIHVAVPSVSGQAVLTMPVFVPLSDLLGLSRQVTVLAYQMGAGLCELLTPEWWRACGSERR